MFEFAWYCTKLVMIMNENAEHNNISSTKLIDYYCVLKHALDVLNNNYRTMEMETQYY